MEEGVEDDPLIRSSNEGYEKWRHAGSNPRDTIAMANATAADYMYHPTITTCSDNTASLMYTASSLGLSNSTQA